MRRTLLVLTCLLAPPGAGADVHKCRMPDGSLAFLDHPCPDAAKPLETPKLASELPFAWRCGKDEPESIQSERELEGLAPKQREVLKGAAYGLAYSGAKMRMFFDRGRNLHVCAEAVRGPTEVVITPEGRTWLQRDGRVERVDRHDRLSRLAACSGRITGCFQPNVRSLDQCVDEAPLCVTSEPVEGEGACCEPACIARYRELRAEDMDPMSALDRALFRNEACAGVKPLPGDQ